MTERPLNDKQNLSPAPVSNGLLQISQVEALLGISARSIYRRVKAGDMPAPIKLGGRTLWRWRELEQWCDAGCPSVGESKGDDD